MTRAPIRIGRFTPEEFRSLISDGRTWCSTFDWARGRRAWLTYDGPTGPSPRAPTRGALVRAPGRLSIAFTTPPVSHQLTDPMDLRVTPRSKAPGWSALRRVPGFHEAPRDELRSVRAALVVLGSVLRDDSESTFVQSIADESADPRTVWERLLISANLEPGGIR